MDLVFILLLVVFKYCSNSQHRISVFARLQTVSYAYSCNTPILHVPLEVGFQAIHLILSKGPSLLTRLRRFKIELLLFPDLGCSMFGYRECLVLTVTLETDLLVLVDSITYQLAWLLLL